MCAEVRALCLQQVFPCLNQSSMSIKSIASFITLTIFVIGCKTNTEVKAPSTEPITKDTASVTVSHYGELADGTPMSLYTLTNRNGMSMKVINYGGIITSIMMPDKNGEPGDIVLGYDSVENYVASSPFFGALIGRYGNRIAKGKFSLDGKTYSLATNNGENHLHGGNKGFDKVVWNIEEATVPQGAAIKLSYQSKDMEEGYPGNLNAEVLYTLTDANELKIDYKATTDKKTIVNLTQHTYFNLAGPDRDILSHELVLNADKFLPVDKTLIPTGELKDVANTPFDFRRPTTIGKGIGEKNEQLKFGNGYDHCWILNRAADSLSHAATLYDSISGREVMVFTTEPGIQFYSGNFLDGTLTGKDGVVYNFRTGLCLETQHFPDSPNRKEFPSVVLSPGETYKSQTIYRFAVRK
jgi:aldose 1-epimerase